MKGIIFSVFEKKQIENKKFLKRKKKFNEFNFLYRTLVLLSILDDDI